MNIVEIYCNENPKNKAFLDNGVKILLKNEAHLSDKDLRDKAEQIKKIIS